MVSIGEIAALFRLGKDVWGMLRAVPWKRLRLRRTVTKALPGCGEVEPAPGTIELTFPPSVVEAVVSLYPDHRLPTAADMTGDWAEAFDPKTLFPVFATGNFRGTGSEDVVVILLPNETRGHKIVALLRRPDGRYDGQVLDEGSYPAQGLFVRRVPPGVYRPGESTHIHGQPRILGVRLRADGINAGMFESADSLFYWDGRKPGFERVWMSD